MGFGRSRSQSIKVFDAHGKVVMPRTMTLAVIGRGLANLPDGGVRFRTTDGIDLSLDVMVKGFVQQFAAKVRSLAAVTPKRFIKITTEIEQLGLLEER
jgi:hypothetical protein